MNKANKKLTADEKLKKAEALLVKKLEEEKMAFKGDFEKLDDEIKV